MTDSTRSPIDDIAALRQELAEREAELAILNTVQQGLASRLEVQAIYELVGNEVRDIFNAQVAMISIYDRQTDTIEHRYAIERGRRVYAPGPHPPGGFRSQIIRTRQPLLINTGVAERAARLGQPTLPGTDTPKSWLGVPMLVGGQVTGILSLQNVDQENAFDESDVRLLQTLAASMSVALENARLWEQEQLYLRGLEREFDIGRRIQSSFLPEALPQPPGWEIAASLKSAREVAGDFYDAFETADGRIGLVIGDVCDKGLGAALFMVLFRSLLRVTARMDAFAPAGTPAFAPPPAVRLKNAVTLTNDYIAGTHGRIGMFATLFFGLLDPRTGELAYVNGGHLPPMLIGAGGLKGRLERTGPAVGAWLNADYGVGQAALELGDALFAFTDGLTETANRAGEFFSADALIPLFASDQPLPAALARIQQRIESYAAGEHPADDVTMLAVRRATPHASC